MKAFILHIFVSAFVSLAACVGALVAVSVYDAINLGTSFFNRIETSFHDFLVNPLRYASYFAFIFIVNLVFLKKRKS